MYDICSKDITSLSFKVTSVEAKRKERTEEGEKGSQALSPLWASTHAM